MKQANLGGLNTARAPAAPMPRAMRPREQLPALRRGDQLHQVAELVGISAGRASVPEQPGRSARLRGGRRRRDWFCRRLPVAELPCREIDVPPPWQILVVGGGGIQMPCPRALTWMRVTAISVDDAFSSRGIAARRA